MNSEATMNYPRLEAMLNDFSIDAVIAFDQDKKIISWNTTAERFYGKTKEEAVGNSLLELIPSINHDEDTLKAIRKSMDGFKAFVPASKQHPHRKHAENHYIPLKTESGLIGVMNIVHDVAHRIKAEERLQYLNRLLEKRYHQLQQTSSELASFTYITSNSIKEPMRHIYTSIEWLIRTEASRLGDSGKAAFRRIQSSINRMDLLLDDILSLAQVNSTGKTPESVDLQQATQEVVQALQSKIEEAGAVVKTEVEGSVKAYPTLVSLLLHHLIDNAVKFNHRTPEVTISGKKISIEEDMENTVSAGDYYRLTVTDNGIGFEEADADKIFGMFEKLHGKDYKGTGMGLTIARKIMQVHDGFIQTESKPGDGASFHCFFPVE